MTTSSTAYPAGDASLLDEVPAGTRIVRAYEPDAWRWFVGRLAAALQFARLPGMARLVAWPDEMVAWGPAAFLRTLREVRRQRPDVIFTTSAPFTSHLVGLLVHRLTGVPWVADFRDEWAQNPHRSGHRRIADRLSRLAERAIARHAAQRTVVASYFDLAGGGPAPVEIPNGVDEADFAVERPAGVDSEALRLSYVGTLYGPQDCRPVLAALRRLIDGGRLDPEHLELRIVGNVWLEGFENSVPVRLTQTGYVEHHQALAEMRSASALLFYVSAVSRAPSGKLYEYLASGRPVLCVARDDNLAVQLVREWGAGLTAAPDDPAGIEAALLELTRRWQAGTLAASPVARERTLQRYGRRSLTAQLAAVFDRVAA